MGSARRIVAVLLLVSVLYVAVTVGQVWLAAQRHQRGAADAIVVLGAAQYDGRPSPALRQRLDHAANLYADDVAPVVWVTGGRRPGDRFSEASAASRYLIRSGVPDTALQLETGGENSYQSRAAAARYLRDRDQRDVLLVSDPWHSFRIAAIARQVGLRPRVSPASSAEVSGLALRRLAHETLAVGLGRILGYRRLASLGDRWSPPL